MTARSLDDIVAELAAIENRGLRRRMREIDGPQSQELRVDGHHTVNFSSNNYLGLANHPALLAAALSSELEGFGAGASRLIAGNLAPHRHLETRIAAWKGTESALLFNSGYDANIGTVSALVGPDDAVYSDELNHASLIDGARLSRAHVHVYPHCDSEALDRALQKGRAYRRRLVLTDTMFSMDGDCAPLAAIAAIARAHDALLLADEAHASGVLGPRGRGLASGVDRVDLQMGTLGKALGGFGAFIAGAHPLIDLLIHRARSFIFTTALPVPVVKWDLAAIDLVDGSDGDDRRTRLTAVCKRFHNGLSALGLPVPKDPCHIVPIRIGDARRTMALSEALLERGIFVQGIRPPTVPEGTSRLRFALMATHSDAHIDAALDALAQLRTEILA